jgi:hypothetical protein
MKTRNLLFVPALLMSCAAVSQTAESDLLDVREVMLGPVSESISGIWDVGNSAMGDDGGLDGSVMEFGDWFKLEEAAVNLQGEALLMAWSENIVSAKPGTAEGETGIVSMEDVQRYIDANPDGFRAMAQAMADNAGALAEAASQQDAETAGTLIDQLNGDCETCHSAYWYPES